MRPGPGRKRAWAVGVLVAADEDFPGGHLAAARLARIKRVDLVSGLLAEDHRPVQTEQGGLHPGLERHPGRQVERARAVDRHPGVAAVEEERVSKPARACSRPGGVGKRARVAVPGAIGRGCPRALVEAVGGNQAARSSACHKRACLVRGRGEIAGAILCLQLVVVGTGGQAEVAVAKPAWLGDPVCDRGRKARAGRAVEVVARDRNVVGCSSPAKRSLACAPVCAQARSRRRARIGDQGLRLVREPGEVAGSILGAQLVVVAAGGEPEVGVEGRQRLCDPVGKRRRKARARAPVEVVARDAHVVARSAPGDVDACPDNRGCHPGGGSRGA